MVMLAPVGKKKQPFNSHAELEWRGDVGKRSVEQPKLKKYLGEGLADQLKSKEGPTDFHPEQFVPEPAEAYTGANTYEVSLPGHPICQIKADDTGSAIGRYNALNGIIQTDHQHTCEVVTGKATRRKKQAAADVVPLIDQLDD